jgi:hypothetical protein
MKNCKKAQGLRKVSKKWLNFAPVRHSTPGDLPHFFLLKHETTQAKYLPGPGAIKRYHCR